MEIEKLDDGSFVVTYGTIYQLSSIRKSFPDVEKLTEFLRAYYGE